jgi:hypothetical protein
MISSGAGPRTGREQLQQILDNGIDYPIVDAQVTSRGEAPFDVMPQLFVLLV